MKKIALIVLLFASLTGLQAQTAPAPAISRVLAVNLWSGPVDIKMGQDGLYTVNNLAPGVASPALVFTNMTARSILFKPTSSNSWMETKQNDGRILNYNIQGGKTYLILVQSNGNIGLYDLNFLPNNSPKIFVVNNTGKSLTLGQIGTAVGAGTQLNFTGINPGNWSNLADISAGTYNAFWNYEGLAAAAQATAVKFVEGGIYALVLLHDNAKNLSVGSIWDVTPAVKNP